MKNLSVYIAWNGWLSQSFQSWMREHVWEIIVWVRQKLDANEYVVWNLKSISPNALWIVAITLSWFEAALWDFQKHNMPVIIASTWYSQDSIENCSFPVLEASNLTLPVVELLSIFSFLEDCRGLSIEIEESHQKTKLDQSGTALDLLRLFQNKWWTLRTDMLSYRAESSRILGVPDIYMDQHAYHRYRIKGSGKNLETLQQKLLAWSEKYKISKNKDVICNAQKIDWGIEFSHNVNGRDSYASGLLEVIPWFLKQEKGLYHVSDFINEQR